MATREYDSARVICTAGGVVLTGFAPGSKVRVTFNEDRNTIQVGSDGEASRSRSNNKSGRIEFILLQTSLSNATLAALALADDVTPGGAAVPIIVKDLNGGSVHNANVAVLVKRPDAEYTDTAGERSWMWETGQLVSTIAGNNEVALAV